ncbi:arylsulfatase [Echinicola sp. 20G]|uniref:arylsulfatase n=1 Tax=Echinicola sp. 20G TaxID=2781961 RepID=UPI0019107CB6|nr:arylsulfatase [Echinicola sp. 20G]
MMLQRVGWLVFMFLGCTSCSKTTSSNIESGKLPNIIFVLADDLGYGDLSCYGQQKFTTPHIDKLAKSGMLFTNHYAGTSVCSPSRASLMTGQHTGHVAIRDNRSLDPAPYGFREREGQFPLPDSIQTLPEVLKSKGYVTGAFGKWGLGGPGTEGTPNNQGFDEFYGYVCQSLAHNYYPDHLWHNDEKVLLSANDEGGYGSYSPDLMHEKALEFIDSNKDQPFFLFVSSPLPHAELIAPKEKMDKFKGSISPGKPFRGVDEGPAFRKGGLASQDQPHLVFAAMVTALDRQVGEVMEKLQKLGLEENTIVIFTSDNGPHQEGGGDPAYFNSNGPLRGIKRDLYEGGIRVPLIVSWPGTIEAGSTNDHISAFWDFYPTLSEVGGLKKPPNSDGISFYPSLIGNLNAQEEHDYLYWEYHGESGKQAVRMGNWKAVRTDIRKGNKTIELFDLSNDLGEATNVADLYPEVTAKADSILRIAHQPNAEFKLGYLDEERKLE